jgi:hypothetical protein
MPVHIEIDPDYGAIAIWENRGGRLERTRVGTVYDGPELGGVRIETPAPGEVRVYLSSGREVLEPGAELAKAEAEAARADAEAARAEWLAHELRKAGIDPGDLA